MESFTVPLMDAVVFCAHAPVLANNNTHRHANLISLNDILSAIAEKLNSDVLFMPLAQTSFAGAITPDRTVLILINSSSIQTILSVP